MAKTKERGALAMRLHAVAIHLLRGVRVADASSGLTPARLSALSVLVFGGGRTIGELASAEQVTPPTMTRLVSGLEADGLVRRSSDARDGRLVRVTATARARRVLEAARSRRVALLGERLDGLSEEEWGALSRAVAALERVFLVAVVGVCLTVTGCAGNSVASSGICPDARPMAGAAFEGRAAAFVWLDPPAGTAVCYGPTARRRTPASTFKIPHTLMALDAGVLDGPDAHLEWDPEKHPREDWWPEEWARDQTLRSALEHSVVWYYREVAELLGPEREKAYLEALGMGNAEVGDRPTSFWLGGPLEVSPEEMVAFMRRLWEASLPASPEAQRLTREMVSVLRESSGERIRGKTGTGRLDHGSLNWLVGVVERPEGPAYYAFWIEADGWLPTGDRLRILAEARATRTPDASAAGPWWRIRP